MADALDLESSEEIRESSSLSIRILQIMENFVSRVSLIII